LFARHTIYFFILMNENGKNTSLICWGKNRYKKLEQTGFYLFIFLLLFFDKNSVRMSSVRFENRTVRNIAPANAYDFFDLFLRTSRSRDQTLRHLYKTRSNIVPSRKPRTSYVLHDISRFVSCRGHALFIRRPFAFEQCMFFVFHTSIETVGGFFSQANCTLGGTDART